MQTSRPWTPLPQHLTTLPTASIGLYAAMAMATLIPILTDPGTGMIMRHRRHPAAQADRSLSLSA
jgi:hypothetical protein